MAKKPNGYDQTEEYSAFTPLPADGYVCVIKGIEETRSKAGAPMFKLALDIFEGEFKDYFFDLYQKRREKDPMNAKWPNDGVKYVMLEETKGDRIGLCSRAFRSLCGALEKCGYTIWDSQENFLFDNVKGKTIGCTFGREQNEWNGKVNWHTKPQFFCTVDDIRNGNYKVPEDKFLSVEEEVAAMGGFQAMQTDDVPF